MFVMIYIINFYCLGGEFVESGIYSKPYAIIILLAAAAAATKLLS
jgi:hypothetical protein